MAKTPTAVANPVSDCQLALGKNPDSGCNPCRRLTATNSAGDCQLALPTAVGICNRRQCYAFKNILIIKPKHNP